MESGRDSSKRHDHSRRGYDEERVNDGEDEGGREKERTRDSGKHRSRDRKKEQDDGADHGSRDKERGYNREKEDLDRDRSDRRRRDRELEKEREDRGKERDKGHGREREKDRDREKDKKKEYDKRKSLEGDHVEFSNETERDRANDKDRERGRDRGKERDSTKDNRREKEKVGDKERDKEKHKDRHKLEKDTTKERYKDKEKEKNKDVGHDKSSLMDRERETGDDKEVEKEYRPKTDGVGEGNISKRDMSQDERKQMNDGNSDCLRPSSLQIEERITKMREERLKKKSDDASEIASWVNKSRVIEDKLKVEKEMASHRLRILDEQDAINEESDDEAPAQDAKYLAGVKVLHGLDKVLEGGAVVLTLKDQNILEGGDLNEDIDMLENVEIGEQKQRDVAYKAAKKRTGIYEDKFNEEAASQRTMLPQYDDQPEDEGITLDERGRVGADAAKKLDELRRRIQVGGSIKSYEDLTSSGKTTSDYYTSEEMLQFKKPKKKKSLRKREKLDLDVLEAEARSAGLGAGDLGSRKDGRRSAREEKEKAEAETRSDAYQSAYAKAEEASKALRLEKTLRVNAEEDDIPVFGEDYEDLQKSLEQARKLALLKQNEAAAASGAQAVAIQALASSEQANSQNASSEPQENRVIITEMEEFVLGLQFNEETRKPEPEDVFMDEEIVTQPMDIEKGDDSGSLEEVNQTGKDEKMPADELKDDIGPDETIHEVTVGKGLSGALKLLKDRGTLKETVDWGGRNMDKKKSKLVGIHESDGPKEIHIERTDEFGRIMTPKEAFRVISHKFHGKGPGKMKQEKRMKQYQEELKLKQMKASDTPSESMERIREAQARLQTPYLVLSGNVKPGQTSDPRSGFATVEKNHLGSLTPMLGDRKVEHFLGIKRKDDFGSSGLPPLPKKPKN